MLTIRPLCLPVLLALQLVYLVLLLFLCSQPDTFVTFEEMTEKLVQEITHHIEAYNLFPTKLRFVSYVFISSVVDAT